MPTPRVDVPSRLERILACVPDDPVGLVQALEGALSAKLLHRTTRQVTVTTDGAAYYERCLRILSDVRDAEESLSRTRLSPSGRLRVDMPTGLASEVLIPALPDFFQRYPDIVMELGSTDRPVDLVEEGVDCAIRGFGYNEDRSGWGGNDYPATDGKPQFTVGGTVSAIRVG